MILLLACCCICLAQTSPYCDDSNCDIGQTCCVNNGTDIGCCPYANGTCCGIPGLGCCPAGKVCDPINRACWFPDNSTLCTSCLYWAQLILSELPTFCNKGCAIVPPPFDVVCEFFVDVVGVCGPNFIPTSGLAMSSCSLFQLCNSDQNPCSCGYCTVYTQGRCLGAPNLCPSTNSNRKPSQRKGKSDICFDGECDTDSIGCCLTCL